MWSIAGAAPSIGETSTASGACSTGRRGPPRPLRRRRQRAHRPDPGAAPHHPVLGPSREQHLHRVLDPGCGAGGDLHPVDTALSHEAKASLVQLSGGTEGRPGAGIDMTGSSRYVDRFERRDGEWRIAHRTLVVGPRRCTRSPTTLPGHGRRGRCSGGTRTTGSISSGASSGSPDAHVVRPEAAAGRTTDPFSEGAPGSVNWVLR